MGTKDLDFVQLNQLIGRKTGGISVFPLTSSKRGSEAPITHIIARGKAMSARTEDLFNLVCALCYWDGNKILFLAKIKTLGLILVSQCDIFYGLNCTYVNS